MTTEFIILLFGLHVLAILIIAAILIITKIADEKSHKLHNVCRLSLITQIIGGILCVIKFPIPILLFGVFILLFGW